MSTELVPIKDLESMAIAVANSKLFGCKTKDEAMALMLLSQAEGVHPMVAVRDFHIIQGRPARKADSILARFQQAGGKVRWPTYSDTEVTGIFAHSDGGEVTVTWSLDKAKKIKAKEDNQIITLDQKKVWREYPAAMMRARCIAEGVRAVYPGAIGGMLAVEEAQDMVDMGDADVVERKPVAVPQPLKMPTTPAEAERIAEEFGLTPPDDEEPPMAPGGNVPLNPAPAGDGHKIVPNAARLVKLKMDQTGKTEAMLFNQFGVQRVEDLPQALTNNAIKWATAK